MNRGIHMPGIFCLLAASLAVAAPNTLDYGETFESYADGFSMPGTNGWSSGASSNAVVSAGADLVGSLEAYGEACGYPVAANHAKVLKLGVGGTVTNQFDMASNQIVWADCMVLPVHGLLPAGTTGLANRQAAVAFDLDGHPAIWHYDLAAGSNLWSVVSNTTVQAWEWVRLTFKFDYQTTDAINNRRYFQVRLNGILLTHPSAWTANDGSGSPGGSWFAMPSAPNRFGALACSVNEGIPAALDDLVVTTNNPLAREVVVASALGQADPEVGTHAYTYGDNLSLSVTNPVVVQGTSQYVLDGWSMSGHDPSGGTGANIQITLTNDLALTWLWATNNSLTANGTPIWWLADHGLAPGDDSLDGDNDGIPTWQEWVCDTDPTNADSVLEHLYVETAEPGMHVYWKGGVLATQVLERCLDLVGGAGWTPLFTNLPPTSISTNFTDFSATNCSGFYRIEAWR